MEVTDVKRLEEIMAKIHFKEGLTDGEIGFVCGISRQAVNKTRMKALKKMKRRGKELVEFVEYDSLPEIIYATTVINGKRKVPPSPNYNCY